MLGKAAAVTINNGLGCPGSQGLWKDLRFTGWPSSPLAGRRRSCTSAHLGHGGKQSYGLKWWGNTCESELATVCTNWYISDVQTGKEEPGLCPVLLELHLYQGSMGRLSGRNASHASIFSLVSPVLLLFLLFFLPYFSIHHIIFLNNYTLWIVWKYLLSFTQNTCYISWHILDRH